MPKPKNMENRTLIHIAIPLAYHSKFKAQVCRDGSNITATINTLIENYLIEKGAIQRPNISELRTALFAD